LPSAVTRYRELPPMPHHPITQGAIEAISGIIEPAKRPVLGQADNRKLFVNSGRCSLTSDRILPVLT